MTDASRLVFPGGWRPSLGAWPAHHGGFHFAVWAPERRRVELIVQTGGLEHRALLDPGSHSLFGVTLDAAEPGSRYGYFVDDTGPFPDPASRWQPDGVHGLSAVVDPCGFQWTDEGWQGVLLERALFYELHVGTFTPAGTFDGVTARLPYLADLGITVVELMPVSDFPGTRNWGYDGASLFAPARCYGHPDDLRRLVDAAHRLGLGVVLDVVYNHFGPDGAYASMFSPFYHSTRHTSPWGAAVNFDGHESAGVRTFVLENALHWLHEYHLDGLRLDASHAIIDETPRHIFAELAACVREQLPHRSVLLVAEDDRNLATIVRPAADGGWGLDAVWSDDFHHQMRRISVGDSDGYYQDYAADAGDLATTIERGWFYTGQRSAYWDAPRGTNPAGVPLPRMVVCLQNHDQIGNRAFGERLHHQTDLATYRAFSAVLLCAPETPLLFMGQEWGASTPFLFFTDHQPELGKLVTAGRRNEFARFAAFRDDVMRSRIPDPQARATFEASRLIWTERDQADHAATLAFYRALLHLRRSDPALAASSRSDAAAPDPDTVVVKRCAEGGGGLLLAARLQGRGVLNLEPWMGRALPDTWSVVLTSDDPPFLAPAELPVAARPALVLGPGRFEIHFERPAAVILRST